MKHQVRIHESHAKTTLPAVEHAARRRRALATAPVPVRVARPVAPVGRKTIDTRFPY